jgi:hypothetical protein
MKRHIHKHPTHPDLRPMTQPKLNGPLSALDTRLSYRHFGLKFWRPQGPLIRVCEMSMDVPFLGSLMNYWWLDTRHFV